MSIEKNTKLDWIFKGILTLAFSVLAWFARENFQEFKSFNGKIDDRVKKIELGTASSESTRFTITDWNAARMVIDTQLTGHDKRITRMEDNMTDVKTYLQRIETKLDRMERRTP